MTDKHCGDHADHQQDQSSVQSHGGGAGHGGHEHEHPHDHDRGGLSGFVSSLFRPHGHVAADSLDDALAGSAEGIKAVKLSLIGLGATALFQLVVVIVSGSV